MPVTESQVSSARLKPLATRFPLCRVCAPARNGPIPLPLDPAFPRREGRKAAGVPVVCLGGGYFLPEATSSPRRNTSRCSARIRAGYRLFRFLQGGLQPFFPKTHHIGPSMATSTCPHPQLALRLLLLAASASAAWGLGPTVPFWQTYDESAFLVFSFPHLPSLCLSVTSFATFRHLPCHLSSPAKGRHASYL